MSGTDVIRAVHGGSFGGERLRNGGDGSWDGGTGMGLGFDGGDGLRNGRGGGWDGGTGTGLRFQ